MARRRIGLVLSLSLLGGLAVALPAEAACALAPPRISLTGFTVTEGPRRFYLGVEGAQTAVGVQLSGGCGSTMSVDFATSQGTATPGQDYQHTSAPPEAPISQFVDGDDSVQDQRQVQIFPDSADEAVVESLQFTLSNPRAPGQATPTLLNNPATILIVDSDGASRVGFEGVPYSQSETFPIARIPVFRAGPAGGTVTVNYTITPDPAAPATPGEDYTATSPGTLQFGPNERVKSIDLNVINDTIGEGPESVIITLENPSAGTTIENAQTIFTIIDNEESEPPSSRFHHPRHKWKYKKSDYRIREFHVFTRDEEGGSGVVAAEIALRRNLRNGKCAWKVNKGWQKKDCSSREWLPTKYSPAGDLFFYRMKQLKPSVKTKIKNYTAFARAIDGAGNVEKDFVKKRNDNTFEIKRTKRRR